MAPENNENSNGVLLPSGYKPFISQFGKSSGDGLTTLPMCLMLQTEYFPTVCPVLICSMELLMVCVPREL